MISKKTITILMLIVSISFSSYAFNGITTNTTDKTKVIFVFSNKSYKMTGIILYESINEKNMESFLQKYKNNTLYLGYIDGHFEERDGEIKPLQGSSLTIVKDRNSTLYKNPNLGLWDSTNKNPNLGLWDSTKISTSLFLNEQNFPNQEFTIYFNYTSWSCKWRGFSEQINKNILSINVI